MEITCGHTRLYVFALFPRSSLIIQNNQEEELKTTQIS